MAQNSAVIRATYQRLLAQDSATLRQLALSTLAVARQRLADTRDRLGDFVGRWKAAEGIEQEAAAHVAEAQRAPDEQSQRRQWALAYMSADLMLSTLDETAAGSTAGQIAADGAAAIGDLARRAAGGALDLIPRDVKIAAAVAAGGMVSLTVITLVIALRRKS